MALNLFTDTIRLSLSEVYHFEEFSNQDKIDRMVSNDLVAVICSDLKNNIAKNHSQSLVMRTK